MKITALKIPAASSSKCKDAWWHLWTTPYLLLTNSTTLLKFPKNSLTNNVSKEISIPTLTMWQNLHKLKEFFFHFSFIIENVNLNFFLFEPTGKIPN